VDEHILEVIKHVITRRIKEYPTSLEVRPLSVRGHVCDLTNQENQEDERTLTESAAQLSLNRKHALVVRVGEKRILHGVLQGLVAQPNPKEKKRKAEESGGKRAQKKR